MATALIYARVSTTMQDEKESLTFQKKKCEDFCRVKGFEIYKTLEDVESGANDERDGFIELQKEIDNKTFDVLIVYESSRISRKTITMLNFVLRLESKSIKFISISQPELDTTTPTGMLFFQIQASLGEYERKQISSRVKSSKLQRAKDGLWQGGTIPIGYKRKGKSIEIDEEQANIVRSMFFHFLSTGSLRETSKIFNRKISSLRWILTNPFYLGKLGYGKKEKNINTGEITINKNFNVYEGKHEAIISQDIFNKVEKLLHTPIKYRYTENKLLFTGLIHCHCGEGKLYKKSQIDKNTIRTYYSCDKCKKSISYKRLETAIIEQLLSMKELEELNEVKIDENLLRKLTSLEANFEKLGENRKKMIDAYSKDII